MPKLHALAPKLKALRTWVPLLTPPSSITSILSPTASTISVSWSKSALEPSNCLPPWLEIILDGGVRRGTHVLKALAAGAKTCSFGRMFLFGLSIGGQEGVEKVLQNLHDEINRNMILMGCKNLSELDSSKLIYRK